MKTIKLYDHWIDENNFRYINATVFVDGGVLVMEHEKYGRREKSSLIVLQPEQVKQLKEALA